MLQSSNLTIILNYIKGAVQSYQMCYNDSMMSLFDVIFDVNWYHKHNTLTLLTNLKE